MNPNRLSTLIKRYKSELEGVIMRGAIEQDKEKGIVRIIFDVAPGAPPTFAEIKEGDVMNIVLDESKESGSVFVKRGAEYVLSILGAAGFEEDAIASVRSVIQGSRGAGWEPTGSLA
jgi:hypothetical protein